MKKLIASALVFALAVLVAPMNLFAQAGSISGVASVEGKPLANVTVRVRNIDTGQLVGNTTSNASGQFSFTGLGQGNFVVETVAANGTVIGTTTVTLTAAALAATGVAVTTSASAAAAAGVGGGISAGAALGGAAGGSFITSGVGLATIAGGAIAATAGVVTATGS